MQQSMYNDIQLLQQHLMLKQLQELRRQQQLPQLCDVRQQNSMKIAGDVSQLPLMNGTFPNDSAQFHTNWDHCGAPSFAQGLPDHLNSSLEQGQSLNFPGLLAPRVGASIYGNPAAGTREKEIHLSHLRGISPETANLANKISDHQQPVNLLQSSALNSAFAGDRLVVPSDQVCMSEGSYVSKKDYLGQNMFGELPPQTHSSGLLPGTFHPDNILQTSVPLNEFSWKQDQAGWDGNMQHKPEQMVPLDPLEKKILYNSDDNAWDASFGKYVDTVPGGSGNPFEPMDTFPSLHSGSWSALMQSAVAETSSGDTALTEEWSGLTYQNPENSTDNQASVIDSGKLHTGWADNSLQSPFSSTSSPVAAFHSSCMSHGAPVFQLSSIQSLNNQHEKLNQAVVHGADQKPFTNAIEWLDRYSMQKSSFQGNQQLQRPSHLNAWTAQSHEYPESNEQQQMVSSYHGSRQPFNQGGENNEVRYKAPNASGALVNADNLHTVYSSRFSGGQQQLQSSASIFTLNKENFNMNNYADDQNMSTERSQQESGQHLQTYNQSNALNQIDIPMQEKGNMSIDGNSDQNLSVSALHLPSKVINEVEPADKEKFVGVQNEHLSGTATKDSAISGGNVKESEGIAGGFEPQSDEPASGDGSTGPHGVDITSMKSVAEKEWAQATNSLLEKLGIEPGKLWERRPQQQAKGRLLLSAQLMQQLLRAPPASTLSVDASSTYDSLTYIVAKLTIGDAYSLTNSYNNARMAFDSNYRIQEKFEVSERNADDYFPKAVEDLMGRATKLIDVFTRMENAASFSDIHVESQELERYSVINRFARFHIRGQPNSTKMSPPGHGAAPAGPKALPQRHVSVHSLPENLPEEVKCLSL